MALVVGTNCGFVTVAPSVDPVEAINSMDTFAAGMRHTSPATATKITEIGWYCSNATEEANFEVGIYTDNGSGTSPQTVVGSLSVTNAKGTTEGWKKVTGLDITISPNTVYWICVQLDNTVTATRIDYDDTNTESYIYDGGNTALPDPTWDIGGALLTTAAVAIYAVWEAAPVGTNMKINISDVFKDIESLKINIGDAWKNVIKVQQNIGDVWKNVFG